MPNDVKVTDGSSFPEYLAQISGTIGNLECGPEKCDISVQDIAKCKKHPVIYFAIYALSNFQSWQESMLTAMDRQHSSMQDRMGDIVQKFTTHSMSSV